MKTTTLHPSSKKSTQAERTNSLSKAHTGLAYWLSGLLAVITLAASAAGFFITDLFQRDNLALGGCARGTALVILVVAVPILVAAMLFSSRGSRWAQLVWLGMLTYIFYNSVYFTFSASFHQFFLLFLAMLSLSGWSLLVLLTHINVEDIKAAFGPKTPVRPIAICLLIPVLFFLLTDFKESLTATISNTLPPTIVNTQLPTNHFHVVDLAFLVPLFLLAATWLWQRRAWGYTLAGMMLTYYSIELLGIGVDQHYGGLADPQSPLADASAMPVFVIGALVVLVILVIFLRNARSQQKAG